MAESQNFFFKQNQDSSKLYLSDKEYIKAVNFRPVTTLGGSNGSLVNIKGNNCEVKFPYVYGVYKLETYCEDSENPEDGYVQVNINGDVVYINLDANTTTREIYEQIATLSKFYTGIYNELTTFAATYNDNNIFIYQNPEYRGCDTISSQESSVIIDIITGNRGIRFIDNTGTTSLTQTAYIKGNDITDPLTVIGSTYINEIDYIYTCAYTNPYGTGQIWEYSFDSDQNISTLKLLYHSNINFSIDFPIPPTATIGRYELINLQRIYWSDNNNPIRSINVKDTQLMSLSPDIINNAPSISLSMPTLYNVVDGNATNNLHTDATYQCSYRLSKNNGAVTNWSTTSPVVHPTRVAIANFIGVGSGVYYSSLDGDGATVDKSLTWIVEGIDTNYDVIEFAIIIRQAPSEDYLIFKYEQQFVNGQDIITTEFVNNTDNFEDISLNEFLIDNTSFTHCKTMEQKDNILFYGNVRNGLSMYLDNLDTRAYRFDTSSNNIKLKDFESDSGSNTYTISSIDDYKNIPATIDAIAPYNLGISIDDNVDYLDTVKYQRNSTIIGGEGPVVKYSFGNLLLRTDFDPGSPGHDIFTTQNGSHRDTGSLGYPHGFRRARTVSTSNSSFDPYFDSLSPYHKFYVNDSVQTLGLEYYNGVFLTGQHNEIYRYALQIRTKNGNTTFSKWVGDIKFPNYSDSCNPSLLGKTSIGNTCPDFRSMYYDGDSAYNVMPYIQFEITISEELKNLAGSIEIVRVKREDNDMTVTSHGIISQVKADGGGGYSMPPGKFNTDSTRSNRMSAFDPPVSDGAADNMLVYHPLKYMVDQSVSFVDSNDKLVITEKYSILNSAATGAMIWPINSAIPTFKEEMYMVSKYYNFINFVHNNGFVSELKINAAAYANPDSNVSVGSVGTYINGIGYHSYGTNCVVLGIDSNFASIDWVNYNTTGSNVTSTPPYTTIGNSKLLAIHFRPGRLKTQYGGRTYLARSSNEYISCGALYRIDTVGTAIIKTFGGDIFHGILDIQRAIKSGTALPPGLPAADGRRWSQTWFFPTQSTYNVDLRSGIHVNADLNDDACATCDALYNDAYSYNQAMSYGNELQTFIPKPANFNETSAYNNRIYFSNVKINGETADSWTVIPVNNVKEVDGNYGPITALINLGQNMHFIQENAIGTLMINAYAMVTDNNNQPITLGQGSSVLDKHIYNELEVGSKHQWSITKSNKAITFIDIKRKKIYMFNGQSVKPVSDASGERGFLNKALVGHLLNNDNPITNKGIVSTYDYANNEFLYTIRNQVPFTSEEVSFLYDDRYTLVYSDLVDGFSAFYLNYPSTYINNHTRLMSINDPLSLIPTTIYQHNKGNYCEFYGIIQPSLLKACINPNPLKTKLFDNLSWITEAIEDINENKDDTNNYNGDSDNINHLDDTFTRFRVYNEYQNTDWTDLDNTSIIGNLRKSEQGFNIQIPRNKVDFDNNPINSNSIFDSSILTKTTFGERIRDKYMIVDLEYNNETGNRFIVHTLKSNYRISDR